jgi:hypothetical protein
MQKLQELKEDYQPIIEQLMDSCDCISGIDRDPELLERNIRDLVNLISIQTCWSNGLCETFLLSSRVEFRDIKCFNSCVCDASIMEVMPHYYPFVISSMKLEVIEISGITEITTEIDPDDFIWSESCGVLRIDLKKYVTCNCCKCSKYKLRMTYNAGFEEIPECLIPLFCDILHVIYNKNKCDCESCQSCNNGNANVIVEYTEGDEVSPVIDQYINNIIYNSYSEQLSYMSICEKNNLEFLGVVV